MNWGRTKTILIIALILTNGILAYILYGDAVTADDAAKLAENQLSDVILLLESENIFIDTEVSAKQQILEDIRLTYQNYEEDSVIRLLLGEKYTYIEEGRYLSGDAEVEILGKQELVYRKHNPVLGYVETDLEKAEELAFEFLEEVGLFSTSVVHWDTKRQDDGSALVAFRQEENGHFVENAYMNVTVRGEELTQMNRKWFGSLKILDSDKTVESPSKALFRLLREIDSRDQIERPVHIVSMDLGYRLVSNILTINFQEGEPSPFWRFRTDDGEVIYIEAQVD